MRRYALLLRHNGIAPVLAVGALTRLGVSMYPLAVLLLAGQTWDLASAGAVAAAAAVGYALTGPMLGRFADRYGPMRPLLITAVVVAVAFAVLPLAVRTGSVLATAAVALIAGASIPPVPACQRALLRRLLSDDLVDTAMAVDAFFLDLFLIVGPLVTTGIVLAASPTAALVTTAVVLLAGALLFARLPAVRTMPHSGAATPIRGLGPLRAPGFRLLLATVAAAGMALGALRVSLIGFAGDTGGLLYTAIGIGSAAGGLAYGARAWTTPLARRYAILLACYAIGVLPLLTGIGAGGMFALAVLTGLALSPVTICEFALVGRCAPGGTVAEAFAWATTATFAGNALGTALGGALADLHWRAPMVLAAAVLATAAAATVLGRALLTAPTGDRVESEGR
ncbi:putative MFS family arabinose efflux permease [Herbihabitans rhizosphaerae]|uniref:Putative MFS family arabinose efflux permease n=1 Tax=Herbihabitans rhizosphaerae TaxID=1872711 RepID=A0A4Q7L661_9PSEU|nr:MFS transporter [Herbihabitans rhizosphaerae]RZS44736.1 putative MFS family arabinose efflux permease [Herbihabitans rhizosphaerae]